MAFNASASRSQVQANALNPVDTDPFLTQRTFRNIYDADLQLQGPWSRRCETGAPTAEPKLHTGAQMPYIVWLHRGRFQGADESDCLRAARRAEQSDPY